MKTNVIKKSIIWVLLFCLAFSLAVVLAGPAEAEVNKSIYTNVLDDLNKDENFSIDDYPISIDNRTLQVIQIAESSSSELFVYVYNPSYIQRFLEADKISMFYGDVQNPDKFTATVYDLELLSFKDGFAKYLVKRWVVPSSYMRYYNFVAIYSNDPSLAGSFEGDGYVTNYAAFKVAQKWIVGTDNGHTYYKKGEIKVLEYSVEHVGSVRLNEQPILGAILGPDSACDSHYISFSVDEYIIEHIYDADLTYEVRTVEEMVGMMSPEITYGEWVPAPITLLDIDKVTEENDGLFEKKYTWNRIMSSSDYIKNFEEQGVVFNEESLTKIKNGQWVFAFAETPYTTLNNSIYYTIYNYSEIRNIGILRLHFIDYRGYEYNLGCVGNLVSGDSVVDGVGGGMDLSDVLPDFGDWWQQVLDALSSVGAAILLIVLVILLFAFCPWIFTFIWAVIKLIFKALWWVISLPFKLIGKLFKRKDKQDKKNE